MKMLKVRIARTQNFVFTKIDDKDFEWAKNFSWVLDSRHMQGYVIRRSRNRTYKLHRLVNKTPVGMGTDHRNRDKLDNQSGNLRTVTHTENGHNQVLSRNNTSGYKGVFLVRENRWRVVSVLGGQRRSLGTYGDPKEAARVFDAYVASIDPLYATNKMLGLLK